MTRVVQPIQESSEVFRSSAVAIGIFDGVHVGHQEILRQTAREAHTQGYSSAVLTFDRHAAELLAPERSATYLNALEQRVELLHQMCPGLDAIAIARFDLPFASLSPHQFVEEILIARLNARHVLIGADFCYGKDRQGNVTSLLKEAAGRGFAVTVVPPVTIEGERISSTKIRQLISNSDIEEAHNLLGHSVAIRGKVVEGKKLGRTIGFPTINLDPLQKRQQLPGDGVYAGYVSLKDDQRYRAAISVGTNPSTDTDGVTKVEAYLLDGFNREAYGETAEFQFERLIRRQETYLSLELLKQQIAADVRSVTNLLGY